MLVDQLRAALPKAWSAATGSRWSRANPAAGQCSVTAIAVQDHLGGEIAKTLVGGQWHFYNVIDARRHDFTAGQFPELPDYADLPSSRDEALADTTVAQYQTLARSLAHELGR